VKVDDSHARGGFLFRSKRYQKIIGNPGRRKPFYPINTLIAFLATFDVLNLGYNAVVMAGITAIIIGLYSGNKRFETSPDAGGRFPCLIRLIHATREAKPRRIKNLFIKRDFGTTAAFFNIDNTDPLTNIVLAKTNG
jgi:hypothetical protein